MGDNSNVSISATQPQFVNPFPLNSIIANWYQDLKSVPASFSNNWVAGDCPFCFVGSSRVKLESTPTKSSSIKKHMLSKLLKTDVTGTLRLECEKRYIFDHRDKYLPPFCSHESCILNLYHKWYRLKSATIYDSVAVSRNSTMNAPIPEVVLSNDVDEAYRRKMYKNISGARWFKSARNDIVNGNLPIESNECGFCFNKLGQRVLLRNISHVVEPLMLKEFIGKDYSGILTQECIRRGTLKQQEIHSFYCTGPNCIWKFYRAWKKACRIYSDEKMSHFFDWVYIDESEEAAEEEEAHFMDISVINADCTHTTIPSIATTMITSASAAGTTRASTRRDRFSSVEPWQNIYGDLHLITAVRGKTRVSNIPDPLFECMKPGKLLDENTTIPAFHIPVTRDSIRIYDPREHNQKLTNQYPWLKWKIKFEASHIYTHIPAYILSFLSRNDLETLSTNMNSYNRRAMKQLEVHGLPRNDILEQIANMLLGSTDYTPYPHRARYNDVSVPATKEFPAEELLCPRSKQNTKYAALLASSEKLNQERLTPSFGTGFKAIKEQPLSSAHKLQSLHKCKKLVAQHRRVLYRNKRLNKLADATNLMTDDDHYKINNFHSKVHTNMSSDMHESLNRLYDVHDSAPSPELKRECDLKALILQRLTCLKSKPKWKANGLQYDADTTPRLLSHRMDDTAMTALAVVMEEIMKEITANTKVVGDSDWSTSNQPHLNLSRQQSALVAARAQLQGADHDSLFQPGTVDEIVQLLKELHGNEEGYFEKAAARAIHGEIEAQSSREATLRRVTHARKKYSKRSFRKMTVDQSSESDVKGMRQNFDDYPKHVVDWILTNPIIRTAMAVQKEM